MVYACEDLFQRLPIHWMWWPAVGGVAIGIGGLIEPHALGVGYDNIAALLARRHARQAGVAPAGRQGGDLVDRAGSGTSGGVLAPLLIMGGALGALLAAGAAPAIRACGR